MLHLPNEHLLLLLLLSISLPAELATKSYAGEPVFDMYAEYFGTAAFLDQPVSFAFAGE
jgi:hypothetical protein